MEVCTGTYQYVAVRTGIYASIGTYQYVAVRTGIYASGIRARERFKSLAHLPHLPKRRVKPKDQEHLVPQLLAPGVPIMGLLTLKACEIKKGRLRWNVFDGNRSLLLFSCHVSYRRLGHCKDKAVLATRVPLLNIGS